MTLCKFGYDCTRTNCGFYHPEGRGIDYQYPPQYYYAYPPQQTYQSGEYYANDSDSWSTDQDQEEQFYRQFYDPQNADEEEHYLDSYERELNEKFRQFVEISADCECCRGYVYDCSCPTSTCFCADMRTYDKEAWFPNFADCPCCKGFIHGCATPECSANGVCLKCSTDQGPPVATPVEAPVVVPEEPQDDPSLPPGIEKDVYDDIKDCSCCTGRIFDCENPTCTDLGCCGCLYHYNSMIKDCERYICDFDNSKFDKDILVMPIPPSMIPKFLAIIIDYLTASQEMAARCGLLCYKLVQVLPLLHDDPVRANEFRNKVLKYCQEQLASFTTNTAQFKEKIYAMAVFLATIAENTFLTKNIIKLVIGSWLATEDPVLLHSCALVINNAPLYCKSKKIDYNSTLTTLSAKLEKLNLASSLALLPKQFQPRR